MTTDAVVYVALGDSTGVGVGATEGAGGYAARLFRRIEGVRPGSRMVNLCVSGATTEDVLRDQVEHVSELVPTLVTLGIGVNDVQRLMLEEYERNLSTILSRVRNATKAPIVVTNIPDISCAPGVPSVVRDELRRRIVSFNGALDRVCINQQAHLVDVYSSSIAVLPDRPEFFCSDQFHPSDAGYEFWANEMWPWIEKSITASGPQEAASHPREK